THAWNACIASGNSSQMPTCGGSCGTGSAAIDWKGTCSGNQVKYCDEYNVLQCETCTGSKMCGYDSSKQYNACISSGGTGVGTEGGPCGSLTYQAACQSTTAVKYCYN